MRLIQLASVLQGSICSCSHSSRFTLSTHCTTLLLGYLGFISHPHSCEIGTALAGLTTLLSLPSNPSSVWMKNLVLYLLTFLGYCNQCCYQHYPIYFGCYVPISLGYITKKISECGHNSALTETCKFSKKVTLIFPYHSCSVSLLPIFILCLFSFQPVCLEVLCSISLCF